MHAFPTVLIAKTHIPEHFFLGIKHCLKFIWYVLKVTECFSICLNGCEEEKSMCAKTTDINCKSAIAFIVQCNIRINLKFDVCIAKDFYIHKLQLKSNRLSIAVVQLDIYFMKHENDFCDLSHATLFCGCRGKNT